MSGTLRLTSISPQIPFSIFNLSPPVSLILPPCVDGAYVTDISFFIAIVLQRVRRQLGDMGQINPNQLSYLAEIYQINRVEEATKDGFVPSSILAQRMLIGQSGINRTLEGLRRASLIEHERYVGVRLTPHGLQTVQPLIRKQGIIESFLMSVMGFSWWEVYPEAKIMRLSVNDVVAQRMWKLAGYPAVSPFGEPIEHDQVTHVADVKLSDAEADSSYRVSRVLTRQRDRLQYLDALDIRLGSKLYLIHKAPFNGPFQIQLAREYRIIGYPLTQMITVVPQP